MHHVMKQSSRVGDRRILCNPGSIVLRRAVAEFGSLSLHFRGRAVAQSLQSRERTSEKEALVNGFVVNSKYNSFIHYQFLLNQ